MKDFFKQQARRINALSLRERAIMFVSLVVALGAVADTLVFSPQMAAQKALAAEQRQQATELEALRAQMASQQAARTADTPLARLQRSLTETREQRRAVDAELQQRTSVQGGTARLPELLERVLRRHERLTLRRLATAPPDEGSKAAAARLPMQSVDLEVSGSYADLARYLAEIETSMPGVRWGELQLSSQTQPPVMKLRVHLLTEPGERS